MAIRITQNATAARQLADMQSAYAKMAGTQSQLNSGLRVTKPSDDPAGTGAIIDFDAQLADVRQRQSSVSQASAFLSTADAALDTGTDALQRIKELLIQGENTSITGSDRQAIATEILQLKETVRDALNAKHGGQYVFAGTSTNSAPYPAPANAYTGTGNVLSVNVAPGQNIPYSVAGPTVVGLVAPPAPGNTLDIIDQVAADVAAGNHSAMLASGSTLDTATSTMIDVRTQLGATANRLETVATRLDTTEERLITSRSDVAEVDATEAFMRFSQQQTMYQAALASSTRMMQTTILDFIR